MPLSHWLVALPLALVLLVVAATAAVTAIRGRAGTLDRGGRLGVRSEAALVSADAFTLANRVAWPIVAGAAVIAGVCGVVLAVAPLGMPTGIVVFVVALAGTVVLLVKAAQLGDRAARTVPRPARKPGGGGGCGGCACGGGGCSGLTRTAPAETATS
ncbi:SdpI family protein [Nakamurella deserti]|uniref:SdpI family protein n=1 Tax=Nakamurella deserti TaxID=2164074 RepID=UPI000DBE316E|nr:SdpI family protein [Nakamurella deserti]